MKSSYTFSFWEQDALIGYTDLCIIGAGIVGLSAALSYRKMFPDSRIMILERGMIPEGASTRNAGFACFGSVSELIDDYSKSEENEVNETIKMRWEGLQLLKRNVGTHNLDYSPCGGIEVFRSKSDFEKYSMLAEDMNERLNDIIGLSGTYQILKETPTEIGLKGFVGMIKNQYEGLLHPGKMMKSLMAQCRQSNIEILFGAEVEQIECNNAIPQIMLRGGILKADKVLVTTNGFTKRLLPAIEVLPARNLVLLTSEIKDLRITSGFHLDNGFVYFRPVGNRLLLGGFRNLDEKMETTDQFGENLLIKSKLETLLKQQILPDKDYKIEYNWSGIMGVGSIKKPIVKMINPSVGVAVRMGGMGIAIGSYIGNQAAEMIRFND